jgi:hypothetical protein
MNPKLPFNKLVRILGYEDVDATDENHMAPWMWFQYDIV